MKRLAFAFDESEKVLRAHTRAAPIRRSQSVEVGELLYRGAPPIASAQIVPIEGFISKWRRAFVKPKYLRGQITQLNLVQMIADIRDDWVKTATTLFPRLKEVFK